MIRRVTIDRSQWLFSGQCLPAGVRVDTVDPTANRCTLLTLPRCVAVAISANSEVRGVRLGRPGQVFAGLTRVIEGAPQLFAWKGGVVDLVKHDWTDGRLELEVAETVEDIAGLSVLVAPNAGVVVVSATSPVLVHVQAPRSVGTAQQAVGVGVRVGGAGAALTALQAPLSADGLSRVPLEYSAGSNVQTTVAATFGGGSAPAAVAGVVGDRNTCWVFGYTDAGAALSAKVGVRAS